MNAYIDSLKMNQLSILDESKFLEIAQDACDQFNDELETTYSLDNIRIAFCSADTIFKVYRDFTKELGFHYKNRSEAVLFGELAEAFVGRADCDDPSHVDGILICTDIPMGKTRRQSISPLKFLPPLKKGNAIMISIAQRIRLI